METPTTLTQWLSTIQAAERNGDLVLAYDRSCQALLAFPDDVPLCYRAVLNLARAGGYAQAERLYREFALEQHDDERIASLGARLLRERALATQPMDMPLLLQAAQRYEAIHQHTRGSFSGVNAAVLWLLAGHHDHARGLARRVLEQLITDREGTGSAYYAASDAATAALLLEEQETTRAYLRACAKHHGGNQTLLSATRRQLRRICQALHLDESLLAPLRPPGVIHYTGHMMAPPGRPSRLPMEAVAGLRDSISTFLHQHAVGYGFGALACGADILIAEALLEHGAELHVVLPCEAEQFITLSVAPGGRDWVSRFHRCLSRASSLTLATQDQLPGDTTLFVHASQLAMGLANLRARHLDAPLQQLAIWDGQPGGGAAGTAANISAWQALGLPGEILPSGSHRHPPPPPPHPLPQDQRQIRALLFGDFRGFSKLREPQIETFVNGILNTLAQVLDQYQAGIDYRNTWGDGLFVVFQQVSEAAQCALALQRAMAEVDLAVLGLPNHLGLRVGVHVGPVMAFQDPLLGVQNFFGNHVSATARVEPITPPGEVYATEDFAALLSLHPDVALHCEYVGRMPAAKHFGELRMYRLLPAQG